jgi:glycolate oxidase FAD binding subunit
MLKPMPQTSAFVACDVPNWDAAEKVLAGLVKTQSLPAAIELAAGPGWQGPGFEPIGGERGGRVLVGLEGTPAEVDWMVNRLQDELKAAGVASAVLRDAVDSLWARLAEFAADGDGREGVATLQVNVLPGDVVEVVRCLTARDSGASVLAHAGSGTVVAKVSLDEAGLANLRGQLARLGAWTTVLRQPEGAAWSREAFWGPPRPAQAVQQAIKDQFDPRNVLNRGRFVFA